MIEIMRSSEGVERREGQVCVLFFGSRERWEVGNSSGDRISLVAMIRGHEVYGEMRRGQVSDGPNGPSANKLLTDH